MGGGVEGGDEGWCWGGLYMMGSTVFINIATWRINGKTKEIKTDKKKLDVFFLNLKLNYQKKKNINDL